MIGACTRSQPCRIVLVAGLMAASLAGCVARRLSPPPRPYLQPNRVDLRPFHLYLREFTVTGGSTADTAVRVEVLQDRFLDYLESAATFKSITYDLEGSATPILPAVEVKVQIDVTQETQRTYLLDALNVLPVPRLLAPRA